MGSCLDQQQSHLSTGIHLKYALKFKKNKNSNEIFAKQNLYFGFFSQYNSNDLGPMQCIGSRQ